MSAKLQREDVTQQIPREAIAARAYQLYLERGREDGHDVDDWLQAEYEVRQLPVRLLAELKPSPAVRERKTGKSLVDVVRMAVY